jgi:hypothetical protein
MAAQRAWAMWILRSEQSMNTTYAAAFECVESIALRSSLAPIS